MEFYVIGVVFIIFGLGLKSIAARFRWIYVERTRRSVSDVLVIATGATIYLFSMILFLGLVSAFEASGFGARTAAWIAWFGTLFLVVVSCAWLGWKVGQGPTQRARMPEAFAQDPDNPFGAPDLPTTDLDFGRDDPSTK